MYLKVGILNLTWVIQNSLPYILLKLSFNQTLIIIIIFCCYHYLFLQMLLNKVFQIPLTPNKKKSLKCIGTHAFKS